MPIRNPRHDTIIQLIREKGFMPIDELARILDVTPQTIRRDINQLVEEKSLRRYHGGATLYDESSNEDYHVHSKTHALKENLADLVADNIPDGSSLFLSIGPNIEAIARSLTKKRKNLCIITNNIHVASIVSNRSDYLSMITSGVIRSSDGAITGIATVDFISQFKVDYSIIGIAAIETDGSLLDFDYKEVSVAQAMMENSRTRYLIADHTQIKRNALVRLGQITDFNAFFTNQQPSNILKKRLDDANISCYLVE